MYVVMTWSGGTAVGVGSVDTERTSVRHRIGLQRDAKVVEQVGGADAVAVEPPVMDPADRHGVEVVVPLATDLAAGHEAGRLQDAQVLHDAEPAHLRQRRLQVSQRLAITLEEPVEQRPPAGVGQRAEHLVVHAADNR